ncbi:MAG: hypothetical protein COA52_16885 [Hyphomicrobiales bacterium]|nr:hypothetical protein [Hyphomicrobiales bacterium]PCJ84905.1 MAG: hypothetical protein COA52_16885 [Hyphomicrobiales bacterium]
MTKEYKFDIKSPSDATSGELAEFVNLVESEGEVISGLKGRVIERGYKLIFVRSQHSLAAVGALKKPYPTYRSDVFKKAETSSSSEEYCFELGWIVVSADDRRRGLSRRLGNKLLQGIDDKSVFATVRTDNDAMQCCLKSLGFSSTGKPYPSKKQKAKLDLFVR